MIKERIQLIFIYSVIAVFIAGILAVGVYFFLDYKKWQGYRNDPNKKVFVERIENTLNKNEKDLSLDDYIGLGNNYLNLNQYNKAIGYYKKAMTKGQSSVANENIAEAYKTLKEYKKAETYYLASLDVDPMTANVYIKLYDLYKISWEGKKYDSGSILELAYTRIPGDPNILVNMALYYKEIGEKAKAIEFFEKTIATNPNNEAAKIELEELKK